MNLAHFFGLDKITKLMAIVRAAGGLKGAIKQRYLTDANRVGTLVGTDEFGNQYFQDDSFFMGRNRWVRYPDRVWLDYDGSQVPPRWHRWIHHMTDDIPTEESLSKNEKQKWALPHCENLSLFPEKKYVPYSTARTKVDAWRPPRAE